MEISKFILILIISCAFASCTPAIEGVEEDTPLEHSTELKIHNLEPGDVEILVIDECEYIVYKEKDEGNYAYGYMAHKGNCSNPIHSFNRTE
ncbi:MAG: hypothetical protein HKN92_07350 [Chitinophagales bacterium]|nr:hypothetical protein [Chitinophagales bacterium]